MHSTRAVCYTPAFAAVCGTQRARKLSSTVARARQRSCRAKEGCERAAHSVGSATEVQADALQRSRRACQHSSRSRWTSALPSSPKRKVQLRAVPSQNLATYEKDSPCAGRQLQALLSEPSSVSLGHKTTKMFDWRCWSLGSTSERMPQQVLHAPVSRPCRWSPPGPAVARGSALGSADKRCSWRRSLFRPGRFRTEPLQEWGATRQVAFPCCRGLVASTRASESAFHARLEAGILRVCLPALGEKIGFNEDTEKLFQIENLL